MLILALALTSQPELARVRGLAFSQVQVEWLGSILPPVAREWDRVLPRNLAGLLWALDCGCPHSFTCRELAYAEFARRGDEAAEALQWGVACGSPEVASRCRRLLDAMFRCRHCKGTGMCRACKDLGQYEACPLRCSNDRRCTTCDGAIDLRWKRTWNDEYEPRNLFERRVR